MSVPSKTLAAALQVDKHTVKTVEALRGEWVKASHLEVDGRIRRYRVVASVALSVDDDGKRLSSKAVRDALGVTADELSNARISQTCAAFALAPEFGLHPLTDDSVLVDGYWNDLDAIRRAGKRFLSEALGVETWAEAIRSTGKAGREALALIAETAREARKAGVKPAPRTPDGTKSPEAPEKPLTPSEASGPALDTTVADLMHALESAAMLAADTDLAEKMTTDQHATALDLLAMVQDRLYKVGESVSA